MKTYTKNCPCCNLPMQYSSKGALNTSIKNNSNCKSCVTKRRVADPNSNFGAKAGEKNYFYKRQLSQESKEKAKKTRERRKHLYKHQTSKYKEKYSLLFSGKNNPMYGRTPYDIWVEKYGEEEAKRLKKEQYAKAKKTMSSKPNPMYGKPAPKKSGNGWSGWYNGWFFRSLRELSYMVNEISKNNLKWISGEKIRIPYISFQGKQRTYSPDFIIEDKYMVEIKPISLQQSKEVLLKKEAAIDYCENNGLIYKMVDPNLLSIQEVEELLNLQMIQFTEKTTEKFTKFKNKK